MIKAADDQLISPFQWVRRVFVLFATMEVFSYKHWGLWLLPLPEFLWNFAAFMWKKTPLFHHLVSSLSPLWYELAFWSPPNLQDVEKCCSLLCQQFPCHAAFRWRGHGRRGRHCGQGCDAGGGSVSGQRAGTTTRWATARGLPFRNKPGLPANSTNYP